MATPDAAPSSMDTTKRGWAVDKVDATVRVKPRRPYTPYNLFYLLERELVVQGNEPSMAKEKATKKAAMVAEQRKSAAGKRAEDDIPIPARYKNVVLLPMWYEPNLKEKRKHRKTHGKISFKDLTEIISKNWASIDPETKAYCTQISEMGRKIYRETMARYNASQKILQLKKEHAAMESAREKRMLEPFQQVKVEQRSPGRKGKRNPVTPERIHSNHAPVVVTPPTGQSNRIPMFVPSGPGGAAAFHQYGPPPPMPPPMPDSHPTQGHYQQPPAMPMYHQQHPYHQHYQQHQYDQYHQHYQHHHHQPHYSYPQTSSVHKRNNHGHHSQTMKYNNTPEYDVHNNGGGNVFKIPDGQGDVVNVNVNVCVNKHQPDVVSPARRSRAPVVAWPQKSVMRYGTAAHPEKSGTSYNTPFQPEKSAMSYNNDAHPEKNNIGLSTTAHPSKSSMTHDEAMRLATIMESESPCKRPSQYESTLNDYMLHSMPSFDFADHNSLSSEDLSSDIHVDGLFDHVENQGGDNLLDLIGGEFSPLELGEEDHHFPDMPLL